MRDIEGAVDFAGGASPSPTGYVDKVGLNLIWYKHNTGCRGPVTTARRCVNVLAVGEDSVPYG